MTELLQPIPRMFPSANMTLVYGEHPILIDSGFGSDFDVTVALLQAAGVAPGDLQMIVNTHYHCDHAGGNHRFQEEYGVPIAAHRWEAAVVNRRDRDACAAEWLDQPVPPYTVTHFLSDDDELTTGEVTLRVIHTPGHTLGHICLYNEQDGTLIAGDAVHADDVSWLNPFREGTGALDRAVESLERLARLPLKRMFSGHSPLMYQPHEPIRAAISRYQKWAKEPHKIGWHALKRIFVYALMLMDGMAEAEIAPYLLSCPWYLDYCRHLFLVDPADFVQTVLDELLRSNAAVWRGGRLYPVAAYNLTPLDWLRSVPRPAAW